MILQRINWHPSRGEIRYFAVTLAIAAILLAVLALAVKGIIPALWLGGVGLALALACFLMRTTLGKWVYLFWMAVTFGLAIVISPIVIGAIFYLILTPIGIIARIFGKDDLRLKQPQNAATYLVDIENPPDRDSFHRQF